MKKLFLLATVIAIVIVLHAQIQAPVKWNYSTKKISPTLYEVHLTANINGNWHLYSPNNT
jgi:hypothetical protein